MVTIPRANYPSLSKQQAAETWKRRHRSFLIRYAADLEQTETTAEQELFSLLDELSDEELLAYLQTRRKKRHNALADHDLAGEIQSGIDPARNSRSASQEALKYCKSQLRLGKSADYGEALERFSRRDAPPSSPAGQQNARNLSDRALAYCKRRAGRGEKVCYSDVRERMANGTLL